MIALYHEGLMIVLKKKQILFFYYRCLDNILNQFSQVKM